MVDPGGTGREREVRQTLRAFITALDRQEAGRGLGDSQNVFDAGVVTSLDVLELVRFIGETWQVEVSPLDVFEGRLASIDGMVSLVLRGEA